MSKTTAARGRVRYRVLALLAALATVLGLTLPRGQTAAHALVMQTGNFPVGNMLDYDNSDFEGAGLGNWVGDGDVSTLTQDSADSVEHGHSMKAVASGTGTLQLKLGNGPTYGVQINLPQTGGEYRIGAYFKGPASTGHTASFDLGCYTSDGTWIGWSLGTAVSLNSSDTWQYVEDDITVPSGCAQVQGSPRINVTGMHVNGVVRIDDVIFAPYRAALAIGAHGQNCQGCTYSASEWYSTDQAIGPLQSDKEFLDSLPTDAPPATPFSSTNCAHDESQVGSTNYSAWPVCIIAYNDAVTSQPAMDNFLESVPAQQEVYLVWHQEPEGDSFSMEPGCGSDTGVTAFICETELQATYVHNSAYDTPNIFIAQDSAGSKYANGQVGADCSWIVPSSATGAGVDLYLVDHYENGTVTGQNVNQIPAADEWQNWLTCASAQNRPLGFGEYGLDDSYEPNQNQPGSLCNNGPKPPNTTNAQNLPAALAGNTSDNTYLAQLPMSGDSHLMNPAPFVVWNYWYSYYGGTAVCTVFGTTYNAITDWQNDENQNGGQVGG